MASMCDASRWGGVFEDAYGPLVCHHLEESGSVDWSNLLQVCRSWGGLKPTPRSLHFEGVSDEVHDEDEADDGIPWCDTHGLHTLPIGLRELYISESRISDWGFLGRLTNLTSLSLSADEDCDSDHSITDYAVRRLCKMPNMRGLTTLTLGGASEATDKSARRVAKSMPGLVVLCVRGWSLTDVGLGHICRLRDLEVLDISDITTDDADDMAFTPDGCRQLLGLPKLRSLYIGENMDVGDLLDPGNLLNELRSRGVEVVWN
jgi:hypothetical protein